MILDLARQGLSVSAIARRTGLDRKTIRKYIAKGLEPPAYTPRPPRQTLVGPFEPYLRERLQTFPELSARRLLRDIRALGYQGGYTVLKDFLRTVQPEVQFERRFETPAGKQAQVDFAFFKTVFTDQPDVERIVWLFSIVLGHSRMMWARFVARQDLPTVLRCHIAAFEAFGGVPEQILYDRMNVLGEVEDPDQPAKGIAYNAKLLDLAAHYGFLPKACKPYRAKAKGKVERPFRYVREDFFLARTFRNLDDLNVQVVQWLDQVANVGLHATTQRVVVEHFAEERGHLRALPAGPFHTPPPRGRGPGKSLPLPRQPPPADCRGADYRRRGQHPGRRHADRLPSGTGRSRPAPDRSGPPNPAATIQQQDDPGRGQARASRQ